MANAYIVDLCEGVRDALNNAGSGEFSEVFTAVFEYAPQYTIPDTEDLKVVVTNATGEMSLEGRRYLQYVDSVRLVIMWRVENTTESGLDTSLMNRALVLLQEIGEFLFQRQVGDYKQTGNVFRGDGEKDKSHFYPGNLDAGLVFAADLTIEYVKGERT